MRFLHRNPSGASQQRRIVWQAASLLLAYPDEDHPARLDVVERAVAGLNPAMREPLMAAVTHLRSTPPIRAAVDYAQVFDWKRRRTLFLTYYTAGDTRNRGMALLQFVDMYRAAGVIPPSRELPDHLAVLLEFAGTVDEVAGHEQLCRHRTPIDMIHDGLLRASPSYAGVIGAVQATLPPATEADLKEARRLAMQGRRRRPSGSSPLRSQSVCGRAQRAQHTPRRDGLHERGCSVLGHRALRHHRHSGGRHAVAVQVRQIRLDHPFLTALREPPVAYREPAVPFRDPGRHRRTRDRPGHPRELDQRSGFERGRVPRPGDNPRLGRRPGHPLRCGDPGLPTAHQGAGIHGHHQERQIDVRRAAAGAHHRPGHHPDRIGPVGAEHNYRESVSVWFRSIWVLQPDGEAMAGAPVSYQIHALIAMTLFALWPFTRLVHAFSAPVAYLFRPYIVYRYRTVARSGEQVGSRPRRRGW